MMDLALITTVFARDRVAKQFLRRSK